MGAPAPYSKSKAQWAFPHVIVLAYPAFVKLKLLTDVSFVIVGKMRSGSSVLCRCLSKEIADFLGHPAGFEEEQAPLMVIEAARANG